VGSCGVLWGPVGSRGVPWGPVGSRGVAWGPVGVRTAPRRVHLGLGGPVEIDCFAQAARPFGRPHLKVCTASARPENMCTATNTCVR
jgi:hypothetical protein